MILFSGLSMTQGAIFRWAVSLSFIAAGVLCLPVSGWSQGPSAGSSRELSKKELQQLQGESAKAFNEYQRALQKKDKAGAEAAKTRYQESSQEIRRRLSEHQQAFYDRFLNKSYSKDGTVTPMKPEDLSAPDNREPPKGAFPGQPGGGSGEVPVGSLKLSGNSDKEGGSSKPLVVIDGSKVPKEIEFPGKKSEKQVQGKQRPASNPAKKPAF